MEEPLHIQAAAKWIELGWTSASNPVHGVVGERFFGPLGLQFDYLICDPITPAGKFLMLPELVRPTWHIKDVATNLVSLFPSRDVLPYFKISVDTDGSFASKLTRAVPHKLVAAVEEFDDGAGLNVAMGRIRTSAARFIARAFHGACMPTATAEFSSLFIKDPRGYAIEVHSRITAARNSGP